MSEAVCETVVDSHEVIFTTLPENGFETMTEDGVEFTLCASALTAQM